MDPPRLPLIMINRTNTLLPKSNAEVEEKAQATPNPNIFLSSTLAPPKPQHPKRLIAPELMTAFAAAVRGSDLTKAGLIEMLKKQYVTDLFSVFNIFFPVFFSCMDYTLIPCNQIPKTNQGCHQRHFEPGR